jgi:lipopolysaccharide transport system ATP-binding protein
MTSSGRAVLFVSHDVGSVARLCKRAIILDGGRITFEGPAEDAVERYLLAHRPEALAEKRRPGTGEARVRRVSVESLGTGRFLRTGTPLRIVVELDRVLAATRLEVLVKTATGEPMVTLATDLGQATRRGDGTFAIACEIEGLPLRPAAYLLETSLVRGEALVDRLDNAGQLILEAERPFDAGNMGAHPAPVVVGHRWEGDGESAEAVTIGPARGLPSARG